MKSASCSMYIFVFFEYSNSMGASPGQGAPRLYPPPGEMEGPLWPSSCFWRTRGTPTMRMRDKVALVTGAGSGIGRATALRLAAEGARVACADVSRDAAAETAAGIASAGGDALALAAGVADDGAAPGRRRLARERGPASPAGPRRPAGGDRRGHPLSRERRGGVRDRRRAPRGRRLHGGVSAAP